MARYVHKLASRLCRACLQFRPGCDLGAANRQSTLAPRPWEGNLRRFTTSRRSRIAGIQVVRRFSMKCTIRRFVGMTLLLLVFVPAVPSAWAQSAKGSLYGHVTDSTG